jgi:uncharacterized protein (TIGR01244 family)
MIRRITDTFWVAPQIDPADLAEISAAGARLILNNRPDFEEPGQPEGAQIRAAAEGLGLAYAEIPVHGGPGRDQVAAMRAALDAADGPVLAYCKSGTRSILTWAVAEIASGARQPQEVIALARNAGYDISRWV